MERGAPGQTRASHRGSKERAFKQQHRPFTNTVNTFVEHALEAQTCALKTGQYGKYELKEQTCEAAHACSQLIRFETEILFICFEITNQNVCD